jgi:hypothetical protein
MSFSAGAPDRQHRAREMDDLAGVLDRLQSPFAVVHDCGGRLVADTVDVAADRGERLGMHGQVGFQLVDLVVLRKISCVELLRAGARLLALVGHDRALVVCGLQLRAQPFDDCSCAVRSSSSRCTLAAESASFSRIATISSDLS